MHTEPRTPAAAARALLRLTGFFFAAFVLWKLVVAPTLDGEVGATGIAIYPLGELVFAGSLIAVLRLTGLLRCAGFRAPLRLRSMWWGTPFLLLALLFCPLYAQKNKRLRKVFVVILALFVFFLCVCYVRKFVQQNLAQQQPFRRTRVSKIQTDE